MTNRRGWVPDGVTSSGVAARTKSSPRPQDTDLFSDWLAEETKPLGGKPTGGVEQAIANQDDWFRKRVMTALDMTRLWTQPFEAFDIEQHFGIVADHGSAWGAVIKQAVKAGIIVKVGYRTTRRPSANGREVRVYRHTANPWLVNP